MSKKTEFKHYPLNEVRPVTDFKQMLEDAAKEYGDRAAFKYRKGEEVVAVSFKEFLSMTEHLGTSLKQLGALNAHLAIVAENRFDWIVCYLTALRGEGAYVPVDKELPPNEILHILTNADVEYLIYSKQYEEKINEIRDQLTSVKYFIALDESEDCDNTLSYTKLMEKGKADFEAGDKSFLDMKPEQNDLKLLVYTSGTTGTAKGVMLSLHNLASLVYYGLQVSSLHTVALSVLPYHHTYESVCGLLVSLHCGVTNCINENLRTVTRSLKLYQPDSVMLVPLFVETMYKKIWSNIEDSGKTKAFKLLMKVSNALLAVGIDMRKVFFKQIHEVFGGKMKKIVCGGAPIRQELGEFFDTIGITLCNGYGITECSPLVSVNRDKYYDFASVGVKLPCVEIKIDNPNENGEGEILVKGETVMLGYYKMPEMTKEVLEESGWFHTGDYGKLDEYGRLYITGRKKNLIVLNNGKNIYPEEIEDYITALPLVAEVIVSALRNDNNEEVGLVAEVYPNQDDVKDMSDEKIFESIQKSIDDMNDKLPSHKNVHKLVIRKEPFEKTTSGKIRRKYN